MRNPTIISAIILFAALTGQLLCGCSEPGPQIAEQTGSGKARKEPGIVEWTKGYIELYGPREKNYTLIQKQTCYQKAIVHFLNSYKDMNEAGHPGDVKRLTYIIMAYRELAAVEQGLGNESGASASFEKALEWVDVLQKYHRGRQGSYYYRGHIYYLMGDYRKAEKELRKDIEIRPDVRNLINIKLLEVVRDKLDEKRYRVPLNKPSPDK